LDSLKEGSKNRRLNTGALLTVNFDDNSQKNILIDCGKYFHMMLFNHFRKLRTIDSVILTHEHADAVNGLDDLRDFTRDRPPMNVYLRQATLDHLRQSFSYLVDAELATGSGYVSKFQYHVIKASSSLNKQKLQELPLQHHQQDTFNIDGVDFDIFSVYHGEDYTCLAFKFYNCVYMSDCSLIPESVYSNYLQNLDVLIIDALAEKPPSEKSNLKIKKSHFLLEDAIDEIRKIKPKRAFLVGMAHSLEHNQTNKRLEQYKEEGLSIECAWDGLEIQLLA